MSAHASSFPWSEPHNRDLSDPELWERSLRRSVHRREITEAARKHAARRKGAAVAVSASMAVGPIAAPFAALASSGGPRDVVRPDGAGAHVGDRDAVRLAGRVRRHRRGGRGGPAGRGRRRRRDLRPDHARRGGALPVEDGPAGDRPGRRQDVGQALPVQRLLRGRRRQDDLHGLRPRSLQAGRPRRTAPSPSRRSRRRASEDGHEPHGSTTPAPEPVDPATNRAQTTKPAATTPAPAPAPGPGGRRLRHRQDRDAGQRHRHRQLRREPRRPRPRRQGHRRPHRHRGPRRPVRHRHHRPAPTAAATATSSASSTPAASPRATPTSRRSTRPRAPTSTSAT